MQRLQRMIDSSQSSESSNSSEDEVDGEAPPHLQLQTGRKRAGQIPGPKASKRVKKTQIFVDSWLHRVEFKMWLGKKIGSDSKLKPFCKTCDKILNCTKTGLKRHIESKSHKKSQLAKPRTPALTPSIISGRMQQA